MAETKQVGAIEAIVTSPEWAKKSALEKAAARRDLFALTLENNPEFKAAVDAASEEEAQAIKDAWQDELQKRFPEAFKVKGTPVVRLGKNRYSAEEADVPVYDYTTESVLAVLDTANKDFDKVQEREKFIAALTPEQKEAILPVYLQRYGTAGDVYKLGGDEAGLEKLFTDGQTGLQKTMAVALPTAARAIPVMLATPTRNPRLIAGASALGEGMAQGTEQMLGVRDGYDIKEGALNAAFNVINPVRMNPAAGAVARAAGRTAEGAALGTGYEIIRQTVLGEPFSLANVGMAAGVGSFFGASLEGGSQLMNSIRARLIGKSQSQVTQEIASILSDPSTPNEVKDQLTNLQRQIDESLNVGAPAGQRADESAAVFQEAMDAPAPRAADTELAARETRAADFIRAQGEELGDAIRSRQIAGDESVVLESPGEPPTFQPVTRADIDSIKRNIVADIGEGGVNVKLAPNEDGSLLVYDLEVAADKQGRGLGTKAIERIKRFSNERGVPVELTAEALDPARQKDLETFYKRNGFYQVGTSPMTGNPIYAYDPSDVKYQFAWQAPETFEGVTHPGRLWQIDEIHTKPDKLVMDSPYGTENIRSTNPDKLAREGVSLPDISELGLPTGRYTLDEVKAALETPAVRSIARADGFIDPVLMRSLAMPSIGAAAGGAYGLSEGDTVEERIKNGLTYAVLGAGGGYMAGRRFSSLVDAIPTSKGPELDKWRKRFGAVDQPAPLLERAKDWPNKFRRGFTTDMAALDQLPGKIAKANNAPVKKPALPLSKQFELVNGAPAKASILVSDYARDVFTPVGKKDWEDFNILLAVKRTGQRLQQDTRDAADLASAMSLYGDKAGVEQRASQLQYRMRQNQQALEANPGDPDLMREADELANFKAENDRILKLIDRKERGISRQVADETLDSVDRDLAALRARLGDKRFDELDQLAAGSLQQYADKGLRIMVASGRMSEAQYAAIKSQNDFYAPFRVMEYADEFDGFRGTASRPIDTTQKITHAIEGIHDVNFHIGKPGEVLAEKLGQSVILAEKNLKMLKLAALADDDASGTIIKKLGANEEAPRGMLTVNYFDNGVPRQLAVSPEVAEAVKRLNPTEAGIIGNFVKRVNAPFRAGATGLNLGFQTLNAPADLYRQVAMSKYGLGRGKVIEDTFRYPLDFIHALYSSIFSRPSAAMATGAVGGAVAGYEQGDTPMEKLRNTAVGGLVGAAAGRGAHAAVSRGVAGLRNAGGAWAAAGERLDPETLYRRFYESGAAGSTLQDMIERSFSQVKTPSLKQATKLPGVITTLQDFGRMIEETTKMMGFKRGLRIEGIDKLSPQKAYEKLEEVASEVRNFGGSPDFNSAGNVVRQLNPAIVFLNPRIQGMVEDGARLFGRDGMEQAAKSWTALAATIGLASAYFWWVNHKPENRSDYEKVAPEERERNVMIPKYDAQGNPMYFTNDRGEQVRDYWRIPLRDTAQNFYKLVNASLDFSESQDPQRMAQFGAELLESLSPVNIQGETAGERVESMISGLGPVGTIPYMLATQRNPGLHREIFRDDKERKALPEEQYRDTTPEIFVQAGQLMPQWVADPLRSPLMLEQLTQAATGGFINQFNPPRPLAGRDPEATRLQQSLLGRRFVRSTYVHNPAPPEAEEAVREQATDITKERRRGTQLYRELVDLPQEERAAIMDAMDDADRRALVGELKNRQRRPSTREIALVRELQVENGARARYIFREAMKRSPEIRNEYISELEKESLLSENVRKQIAWLYRQYIQEQN